MIRTGQTAATKEASYYKYALGDASEVCGWQCNAILGRGSTLSNTLYAVKTRVHGVVDVPCLGAGTSALRSGRMVLALKRLGIRAAFNRRETSGRHLWTVYHVSTSEHINSYMFDHLLEIDIRK